VGVRSEIQLCRGCGRERERKRIEKIIKKGEIILCSDCGMAAPYFNDLCLLCFERQCAEEEKFLKQK